MAWHASIRHLPQSEREERLREEILAGNVPDFMRSFRPIPFMLSDGRGAELFVSTDYLSIGSDADFIRVPVTGLLAAEMADTLGLLLPTPPLVDAIHQTADLTLAPSPFSPDFYQINDPSVFLLSHQRIQEQIAAAGHAPGVLVSGIKKDIVFLTRAGRLTPGRVAIYGWHGLDGTPIQPPSTVHHAGYVDYSHGLRLVSATARIDDEWVPLTQPDLPESLLAADGGAQKR